VALDNIASFDDLCLLYRRIQQATALSHKISGLCDLGGIKKGWDTVGELKSAAICVSYMPSLKAKTLGELAQEKVLLEL
jgi:hypothetical protein